MALSDCPKCWDTPCECGYMFKDWSLERKQKMVNAILGNDKVKSDKMYNRKEVETIIDNCLQDFDNSYDNSKSLGLIDKWIKENL